MSSQRIATRYAKSLLELAVEQNKLDRVLEDVEHFRAVTRVRDFLLLLKSPIVHQGKKRQIFRALFADSYDTVTMAFLDIILRKGREAYLDEIAEAFVDQYREVRQITTVKLTTAVALDDKRLEEIKTKISQSEATFPNIELQTEVNPDILGGFIIEFEDNLYDASVAHQMEQLRKEFAG
jgi:F-type H+-transporting ATPase subunit delta